MTTWDTADVEDEWTGDQYEYRRLTDLQILLTEEGKEMRFLFLEDERDRLVVLDDRSVLAAVNRLGAGGWLVSPVSTERGEVPGHLIKKLWETRSDVRRDGALWTRYWLSRRRLLEELSEPHGELEQDDIGE